MCVTYRGERLSSWLLLATVAVEAVLTTLHAAEPSIAIPHPVNGNATNRHDTCCRPLFIASNTHLRMALQDVCNFVLTQTRRVLEISIDVTKPRFGSHAPGERAVYQSLALSISSSLLAMPHQINHQYSIHLPTKFQFPSIPTGASTFLPA